MTPNIKIDTSYVFSNDIKMFSDKIESVCSKIKFSYKDINWIIYDYKDDLNPLAKIATGITGEHKREPLGFVDYYDNIHISTFALSKGRAYMKTEFLKKLALNNSVANDPLANVIIEGLAYIAASRNNNSITLDSDYLKSHDEFIDEFMDRYYKSYPFNIN